jgi:hypothetical protein
MSNAPNIVLFSPLLSKPQAQYLVETQAQYLVETIALAWSLSCLILLMISTHSSYTTIFFGSPQKSKPQARYSAEIVALE